MAKKRKNDRLLWFFLFGAFACAIGLIIGLVVGLRGQVNVSNNTTTTTTTAVTIATTTPSPTTTTTTTPSSICPCNASYAVQITTPHGDFDLYYMGTVADYYAPNDTLTYVNSTGTDWTLTNVGRCSGVVQWTQTLCPFAFSYGLYVAVDQVSGDTYAVYQCGPDYSGFLDRFSANGTLIWRQDLTNALNGTLGAFTSPIVIDVVNQQIYFAVFTYSFDGYVCAFRMDDGSNVWCMYSSSFGTVFDGVIFDNFVYAIALDLEFIWKIDPVDGTVIEVLLGSMNHRPVSYLTTDFNGSLYVVGEVGIEDYVFLFKYNAVTFTLMWSRVIPGVTLASKIVIYDPVFDVVAVLGISPGTNVPSIPFGPSYLWIATVNASNGLVVNYFRNFLEGNLLPQTLGLVPAGPGAVFYTSQDFNETSNLGPNNLRMYCFNDDPPLCETCNTSFLVQSSPVGDAMTNVNFDVLRKRLISTQFISPGAVVHAGTNWSVVVCGSGVNTSFTRVYVTVDQEIGDVYVTWTCLPSDNAAYLAKYDGTNGTQLWLRTYSYNSLVGELVFPSDAALILNRNRGDFHRLHLLLVNSSNITFEIIDPFSGVLLASTVVNGSDTNGPNRLFNINSYFDNFVICGYANGIRILDINYFTSDVTLSETVHFDVPNVRHITGVAGVLGSVDFVGFVVGDGLGSSGTFLGKFILNRTATELNGSYLVMYFEWIFFFPHPGGGVTRSYGNTLRPVYHYPLTDTVYTIESLSNGTMLLSNYNATDGSLLHQNLVDSVPTSVGISDVTFAPNDPCGTMYIQYHVPAESTTNITRVCL